VRRNYNSVERLVESDFVSLSGAAVPVSMAEADRIVWAKASHFGKSIAPNWLDVDAGWEALGLGISLEDIQVFLGRHNVWCALSSDPMAGLASLAQGVAEVCVLADRLRSSERVVG
jgi:hypothetical protein